MTNFCSDNVAGAPSEVLDALRAASEGLASAFDNDPWTSSLRNRLAEVFERPVDLFLVPSGTAANALAVSVLVPAHGAVLCHEAAHVETMECGAVTFYSGGAKLVLLAGEHGKIPLSRLQTSLSATPRRLDANPPKALTLTQATEAGTVYSLKEIATLAECAHAHGLKVHMDGSRFANALVALSSSPADMTWRAGVDILSFGCTKNGTIGADAILSFDPSLSELLQYRRKRGGLFMSKSRFLAAQIDAYLANDLWLRNATHANAMAKMLSDGLRQLPEAKIRFPVQVNEVFVELPEHVLVGLIADGFQFTRRGGDNNRLIRLVTSFATRKQDVAAFLESAHTHSGGANVPLAARI